MATDKIARKNKRKRRKRILRFIVKTIMTLLLLAIVVGGIGAFVVYGCVLKNVTCSGTELYSDSEIKSWVVTGDYSDNTIYVVAYNMIKPVTGKDFIDHFEVKPTGLNSINIKAVESDIFGYLIQPDGSYVYFDYDGKVVAATSRFVPGYILVRGVNCTEPVLGEDLDIGDRERYYLLTLSKLLEKYELNPDSLFFDSIGGITLCFAEYDIELGSNSFLEEKLERLPYILPSIEGMNGILHLENYSNENTDIVFEKVENGVE